VFLLWHVCPLVYHSDTDPTGRRNRLDDPLASLARRVVRGLELATIAREDETLGEKVEELTSVL
jgi:hypothetical protein